MNVDVKDSSINNPYDNTDEPAQKETAAEYRSRWWSIRLMYFSMFFGAVGFSIVVSSVWPYLQKVDDNANTTLLGLIVASFSLGQLIGSPLFGFWFNHRQAKEPMIVSLTINILGNLLYALVQIIPYNGGPVLLAARFLCGFGAANLSVARSYTSHASTLAERTGVMANISIFQSIGFILGPVIQTMLVPVGENGIINLYTLPAYLSTLVGIINLVLIIVIFKEHRVSETGETETTPLLKENKDITGKKIDHWAVAICNFIFFTTLFHFTTFETILTPFTIDMYAWAHDRAVLYCSILLAGCGLLSIGTALMLKPLTKRFDERDIMIAGLIFTAAGYLVFFPYGHQYPVRPLIDLQKTNLTVPTEDAHSGCSWSYSWCGTTAIINIAQLVIFGIISSTGYTASNIMDFTIYSKILGPKPQGLYMGLISASGSFARTVGPIYVSKIYAQVGPLWTFFSVACLLLLSTFTCSIAYWRLLPFAKRNELTEFMQSGEKKYEQI